MSDSWVKANSRHPDNCQEYDVIFADVVGEKLAELEAERDALREASDNFLEACAGNNNATDDGWTNYFNRRNKLRALLQESSE